MTLTRHQLGDQLIMLWSIICYDQWVWKEDLHDINTTLTRHLHNIYTTLTGGSIDYVMINYDRLWSMGLKERFTRH